ncbi:Reverse transcriptase domain-containing protein [Aphis craccivora]|uniref:Reverse transcriptase domain-containing protein n=1 Tax=Aphis craccivora TaxID=307492 RepID=A0A6G0Y7P2_APHCR|nr:Reverse transcriptase domain-containing protein [Aphis craccivora]
MANSNNKGTPSMTLRSSSSTSSKPPTKSTSVSASSVDAILLAIEDLRKSHETFILSNKALSKELKSSLAVLTSRFDALSTELSVLRNIVVSLDTRLLALESCTTSASTPTSELLQEFDERDRCKSNIIEYGIPEPSSSDLASKISEDKEKISSILSQLNIGSTIEFKVTRIANFNCSDLPTDVKFFRDKTSLERKTLRACHQELDRRTQNGEADLTISYINVLTETWLNGSYNNTELGMFNYNIYRCDRSLLTSNSNRGGGVIIAIRKDFQSFLIPSPNLSLEQLFYFNLPEITWSNDVHGLSYSSTTNIRHPCFPEKFAFHGLYQINSILNSHGSLHDLIFTNTLSVNVNCSIDPPVKCDLYHPVISLTYETNLQSSPPVVPNTFFFNFKNANYESISKFLNSFNWLYTFQTNTVDTSFYNFFDAIHSSILKFVPRVTKTLKPTFQPWFTNELIELVFKKHQAHKKFKKSSNLDDYQVFSKYRAHFWKFVRKNKSSSGIPSSVDLNGEFSNCNQESANLFAKHFESVYTLPITPSSNLTSLPTFYLPSNAYFSVEDVYQHLFSLRGNVSLGPDGIPGDFLFKLRDTLSWPFWLLFRKSLDMGIFPSLLKSSSLIPFLKTGNPSKVMNYRPIANLSHVSKMFETLVLRSIQPSVNSSLIEEQHGFRPGSSTVTCNLVFSSFIYDSFALHAQVDAIYTDFNKVFDRVNHNILINILSNYGFGEPILSWFSSYLTNRQQYIKLHDSTSIIITLSSDVPQGAILSPLLFSLLVNSAASVLRHARILIFADDMKLFMRIHNENDACLPQSDLNRLVLWSESLSLSLNISKCFKMSYFRTSSPIAFSYSIHDTPISNKSSVRDLGFYFLPNLSPRLHIQEICCKSPKLLGFIKRISSEFKLDQSLKILFCSLVRPILEYRSVIWDPHLSIETLMIERVQRKFLLFAAYSLKIHCPLHDYKLVLTALS